MFTGHYLSPDIKMNEMATKFRTFLSVLLLTLTLGTVFAQEQEKPKLIVGLVVDQMRWDYLYKYCDRFQEGGFKRLLNEGTSFENTYINYTPSSTAAGHAAIYTGTVPAIHGMVGNDYYLLREGRPSYCVEDSSVSGVGTTTKKGFMSPRNLLSNTITDELRMASNYRSKVVAISFKDRGAIIPGGHMGTAYWYDDQLGHWVTSSHYMDELPTWVKSFNDRNEVENMLRDGWKTMYALSSYQEKDSSAHEIGIPGIAGTKFPYRFDSLSAAQKYKAIRFTPFGDLLTLKLAEEAILYDSLGMNPHAATDFLAISFSATDEIGHEFGINSVELEDAYLRLDTALSIFFSLLDRQIGEGNYLVFLSSDHGAAHNQGYMKEQGAKGGFFTKKELMTGLNKMLLEEFGADGLVRDIIKYQIYLNHHLISEKDLNEKEVMQAACDYLLKKEGISHAVAQKYMHATTLPPYLRSMMENGYHPDRSGDIMYIPDPQWYSHYSPKGTTHGVWNSYDTHIPLVFMGWGIPEGKKVYRRVEITDIAPTLAALLRIQEPNGCVGNVLIELLEK
jgi:predicted AlkP superfamily pyrophosphatase or phosphodiesterase